MKLKSIKVGQFIIMPKTLLVLILAFFIFGLGIGATVAASGDSILSLFMCSIISLVLIVFAFSNNKTTE